MARAVLNAAAFFGVLLAAVAGPARAESPPTLACRGGGALGREVVQVAVTSPLYTYLAQHVGTPQTCAITAKGGSIDARIGFADGSEMAVEASPEIGFAAYAITLSDTARRPGDAETLALLGRMEDWAAPDGCGLTPAVLRRGLIGPGAPGVAEGDACNCRAELSRDGAGPRMLRFSAAC